MQATSTSSQFEQLAHPFVWTTADDRNAVLANVNEPIWHRFLEEAETHFSQSGELPQAAFPVWCHHGDLDEVMAVCVLAYVRNEPRLWHWIGDWLRGALKYYQDTVGTWREHRYAIMRGETYEGSSNSNPRQTFEGFVQGGSYWVEAGLSSVLFHLLDQLEAYAPGELSEIEKVGLLEAIADYAERYAFHEERVKYNNRALWANSAILLAGLAQREHRAGELLRFQSTCRHAELRSAFLDDGFHIEGAADYHLMAADGLLSYLLTASNVAGNTALFEGISGEGPFQQYPDFADIVRAYLKTVIPGPTLWNYPRGCSVSTPVTVRPALVHAWKLSRDPELGWLLRERMGDVAAAYQTPLKVTSTALLGLGHYQPLLNFWLYREVDDCRLPTTTYHNMADFGAVFSRSSWEPKASCVTARYGYEGTGKGHRDHAHVTAAVGGVHVLKDPFPRYGPRGLDSAMFHNTVVLDECEPNAVVGRVQTEVNADGLDACLIINSGGSEPSRHLLSDPAEETNYWFSTQPQAPDHCFQRAVIHLHGKGLVLIDRVVGDGQRCIDWLFHSEVPMDGYEAQGAERVTTYRAVRHMQVVPANEVPLAFRGDSLRLPAGQAQRWSYATDTVEASLQAISLDAPASVDLGHQVFSQGENADRMPQHYEEDYYLRMRCEGESARAVWALSWAEAPLEVAAETSGDLVKVVVRCGAQSYQIEVDFAAAQLTIQ